MQKASRSGGSSSTRCVDRVENAAFFLLSLGVQLIEAVGDVAGAGRVFHAEQFNDVFRHVHAAGGIQARRDAERHFAGAQRTRAAYLRHFEQRPQPGIHRGAQGIESELGEDAVFAGQRHRVGHGCDRHHLHERGQHS